MGLPDEAGSSQYLPVTLTPSSWIFNDLFIPSLLMVQFSEERGLSFIFYYWWQRERLKTLFSWLSGKLSGYCELWNSFLLFPADKMHFLEANCNVKSSPDFIWNVRWELSANWHRRALTRTVAVNASFWVWFFWFWRSELNTGKTCQRIWWIWLQRLLQRTWIPEVTCGIFVWQHQ